MMIFFVDINQVAAAAAAAAAPARFIANSSNFLFVVIPGVRPSAMPNAVDHSIYCISKNQFSQQLFTIFQLTYKNGDRRKSTYLRIFVRIIN